MTVGLLCLCVTMQMLGAPISLWDIDDSFNKSESSASEGFSVPSMKSAFDPPLLRTATVETLPTPYLVLLEHSQLRLPTVGR